MGMYSRNRGLFDPRLMEKPVYRSLVAVRVVEPRLGVRRVPDGEKFRVAMVPGGGVQLLPHGKRDKIVSGTVDDEERKPVFPNVSRQSNAVSQTPVRSQIRTSAA